MDWRNFNANSKKVGKTLFVLVWLLGFSGCSNLILGVEGDVYSLTDGRIVVYCRSKAILEELRKRVDSKKVDWELFRDREFAEGYLRGIELEIWAR